MEYRCISADCHIDITWLPYDLFVSNASREMKDRMPYVGETENGPRWMLKSGLAFGFANGPGGKGAVGSTGQYNYVPGEDHRLDRMEATGLFSDGAQGIFRPTTAQLRLKDQERDGIQAEVIYGLLGTGTKMTDRNAAVEFYRIYNDWLADFCSHDRNRFVGLASIPSHTPEAAAAETRRVAKLGLGGLDFATSFDMIPLWDPYWDPFWKAAEDMNLAVHFHTIGPRPEPPPLTDIPEAYKYCAFATRQAGFQLHVASILAAVINGGALDRFPKLRIVLGESGIGWIPYVLNRMDNEFEGRFMGRMPFNLKPSEYWRRQCRATFQNDPVGAKLLDELGVENVMWGSDYPHRDGVFPDSQEYIERQFGHLPAAVKRKITCENAGRFYGLI